MAEKSVVKHEDYILTPASQPRDIDCDLRNDFDDNGIDKKAKHQ